MNRHIIQKQTIELVLDESENFHSAADALKGIMYHDVLPKLSLKMDGLADEHFVVAIEKMEIDLGVISWKDQNIIGSKIIELVMQELMQQVTVGSGRATDSENISTLSTPESRWKSWLQYLKTGIMPWYAMPEETLEELEAALLNEIDTKEKENIKGIILEILDDKISVGRLLQVSSLPFIAALRKISGCKRDWERELLSIANWLEKEISLMTGTLERKAWNVVLNTPDQNPSWSLILIFLDEIILNYPQKNWFSILSKLTKPFYPTHYNFNSEKLPSLLRDFIRTILTVSSKKEFELALLYKESQIRNISKYFSAKSFELVRKDFPPNKNIISEKIQEKISDKMNAEVFSQKSSVEETSHKDLKEIPLEDQSDNDNPLYLQYAGLVIIGNYLPHLFEATGLLNNDKLFRNRESQAIAVRLTGYLASGQPDMPDWELSVPKILCGLLPADTIHAGLRPAAGLLEEGIRLLEAVIKHWTALGNTSPDGLREGFLRRPGKLSLQGNEWIMQVEGQTLDILMEQLPWSFGMIQLPWMKNLLVTEWQFR